MTIDSKPLEDTTTHSANVAGRGGGVRLEGALSRIIEPYVLFPLVALVILAVLWAATFKFIHAEDAGAQRAAVASARDLLATYEAQVVRALREIDQTLKFVQYSAELQGDTRALQELQERALLPPNLLFVVSLVDRRGVVVASTGAIRQASVSADDDFLKLRDLPAANQGIWVDRARRYQPTEEWRLRFSRRMNAQDGSFAGIVTVSVDASYFVSGYDPSKIGEHGVLGLLGTDGVFRVRRSGDTIVSGDSVNYSTVVAPSAGDDDAPVRLAINPWDSVQRFMSARELYDFPLAVVVGLSAREQLATAYHDRRLNLQRAAAASVMIILLAVVLGVLSWQLLQSRRRESAAKVAYGERVEYLAYHDGLTGLPNRSLLSRLLTGSIKSAHRNRRRMAVSFIDLDGFKHINDTLGHDAGDELLQEVARRLQSCLRESDTVARLGGDEFVVLLPDVESGDYAAIVAQKILNVLAKPYTLMRQEFFVTASIGISTYPEDGEDEQMLTKRADIAMYQAKDLGRNNFQFYSKNLDARSLERLTLESSLRHALDRQEFRLCYQAKRDIRSGRVTGMEALLRWQHPDLGIVAPMKFIPVAEETGLILPIGKWVLMTACLQNVAWLNQGLPEMSMAVNLTPRQFSDEHLLQDVADILRESGMRPQLLELEITESLLIHDVEKTVRIMTGLRALGVKIAVDDFGTCYSSLSTLRQFPLDSIKIDRSFIRNLMGNHAAAGKGKLTLADAVIAMGRTLSLTVVAQGVETKDQADYLRLHACDEVQGFYINKPLPTEQATHLLQQEVRSMALVGS